MGDEMDGCECVWTQEFAMQRLLAFIRQNQNHCSNIDCADPLSRAPAMQLSGNEGQSYIFMTAMMFLAVFMMFVRPSNLFKGRANNGSRNGDSSPPPPPPAPPAIH